MSNGNTPAPADKKTRTPWTYESIEKGAKALELKERVALVKSLQSSIDDEVKLLKQQADEAAKIAGGTA